MPGIPQEILRILRAQQQRATKPVSPFRRTITIPMEEYTGHVRTPIANGYGAAIVAGGTATVTVGPQGVGTKWYPQNAAISTTTGANDTSTCTLFLAPASQPQLIIGQSYAGGGDSVGLGVPPLVAGYFIIAVWKGAHNGDLATLAVYGTQDALVRRTEGNPPVYPR